MLRLLVCYFECCSLGLLCTVFISILKIGQLVTPILWLWYQPITHKPANDANDTGISPWHGPIVQSVYQFTLLNYTMLFIPREENTISSHTQYSSSILFPTSYIQRPASYIEHTIPTALSCRLPIPTSLPLPLTSLDSDFYGAVCSLVRQTVQNGLANLLKTLYHFRLISQKPAYKGRVVICNLWVRMLFGTDSWPFLKCTDTLALWSSLYLWLVGTTPITVCKGSIVAAVLSDKTRGDGNCSTWPFPIQSLYDSANIRWVIITKLVASSGYAAHAPSTRWGQVTPVRTMVHEKIYSLADHVSTWGLISLGW